MYHLPVALSLSATTNYKMVQHITAHMQRKIQVKQLQPSWKKKNPSHPGPTFGDCQDDNFSSAFIHSEPWQYKGEKINKMTVWILQKTVFKKISNWQIIQ